MAGKVFTLGVKSVSAIALISTFTSLWQHHFEIAIGSAIASVLTFLGGLAIHYRRQKNVYAEHILAVGNASRYLSANLQTLSANTGDARRVLEQLLRDFRSIHDTVSRNPQRGWQVALWFPDGPDKLKIIGSVDVSRSTEAHYFMGTAPGCVDGLAWKAWQQRKSLCAKNAPKDPRVDHDQHPKQQNPDRPTEIGALLCQVVYLDEHPVGVISINHEKKDLFRKDHDDARAAIAALVAIALSNCYDCRSEPIAEEVG